MALVPMRKTPAGQEYWDKVNKKSVFYPHGSAPKNIQTEGMVGQYAASGKVNESTNVNLHSGETVKPLKQQDASKEHNLDEMDEEQLQAFAEQNNIDVPGNMKKAETIRNFIKEQLNAAADSE